MNSGELARRVRGRVVRRGDEDYESIRREMVWNELKPARFPEIIVSASNEDDVAITVQFARESKLKVAVRGSGHSWYASPLRDDGIMLDVSGLRTVQIDGANRSASVGPGVDNRELVRQLTPLGLAFPYGHCSDVALSGYLLNGGIGWNSAAWGLACMNVSAVDVVTAEGQLLRTSEAENSDYFWAARGSGPGFFGVAVRYHLRLHPLPRNMRMTTLAFPLDRTDEVVKWAAGIAPALPPIVEMPIVLCQAPPPLNDPPRKVIMVIGVAFADSPSEATEALKPLGDCPVGGRVMKEADVPVTFDLLYDAMDQLYIKDARYAGDTLWSASDPVTVLHAAAEQMQSTPSSATFILGDILPPPPPGAPPLPDMAFSMMAPLFVGCYSIWRGEEGDVANTQWLAETMDGLLPFSVGHYIGETDLDKNPARAEKAYAQPNWAKLNELRVKYDPEGVFHGFMGQP